MTSTFKQSKLMKSMHDEDNLWNSIPYELKCKGEIECYDKLSELHPKYPIIIYNHALRYKQRLKKKRLVISSTNDTSNQRKL